MVSPGGIPPSPTELYIRRLERLVEANARGQEKEEELRTKVLDTLFNDKTRDSIFNQNVDPVNRRIYLTAPVNGEKENLGDNSISTFIKGLTLLNSMDDKPITLVMNCPGGSVPNGFAVYDSIARSNAVVNAEVYGGAASMGVIILQACAHRALSPITVLMLHKASMSPEGGNIDLIRNQAAYLESVQDRLYDVLVKRTKQPRDMWEKEFGTDKYINAKEAIGLNLADAILPVAAWRMKISKE